MALPQNNPIKYRTWCNRCKRYHEGEPFDEVKAINKHAQSMADEIDKQVMEMIKNERTLR